MKTIYKNDEPQEILQWKSKFKNKNGRVTRYSDLNEVENLLASCQGYHDREENCGHSKDNAFNEELFVSPLEENCESLFEFSDRGRLKLLMEMNGLGIRLSY